MNGYRESDGKLPTTPIRIIIPIWNVVLSMKMNSGKSTINDAFDTREIVPSNDHWLGERGTNFGGKETPWVNGGGRWRNVVI